MVVVPLSKPTNDPGPPAVASDTEARSFIRVASAGTLIAGGLLLLNGKHRAGLVAAAAGAALTMLDQQETVRSWWKVLPGYIGEVQRLLGQVQGAVDDLAARRDKLRRILAR
jgi:hypothetical protein